MKHETVWSYQLGIESSALKYVWIKLNLFLHDTKDQIVSETSNAASGNRILINSGKRQRKGFELTAESVSFYHLSLLSGTSFIDLDPQSDVGTSETYSFFVAARFNYPKYVSAILSGNYVWWNYFSQANAKYNHFIWDLNASKKFDFSSKYDVKIFMTAHNLFNSSQYTSVENYNPDRWVEGGLKLQF